MPNTGYQDADFFLGAASNYTQRRNAPFGRSSLQEFDLYFQDNYRIRRNLTLNLGVRWEGHPAPRSDGGNYATFSRENNAIVLKHPIEHYYDIGYTTAGHCHQSQEPRREVHDPAGSRPPRRRILRELEQHHASPRLCVDARPSA